VWYCRVQPKCRDQFHFSLRCQYRALCMSMYTHFCTCLKFNLQRNIKDIICQMHFLHKLCSFSHIKNWGNTPKLLCSAFPSNNLLKLVIRTWKLQNIISAFWTLNLSFYCIVSILYRSVDGKSPNLLFFNNITFHILCQLCPVVDVSLCVSLAA
jgi:hypothetical protein